MAAYKSRGEAIRSLRKASGMSQEALAKRLDTTKQTIYKYENGIVTNIPSDKIEAMSRIFDVSPAVIMCWEEPSEELESDYAAVYKNSGHAFEDPKAFDAGAAMSYSETREFRVADRSMEPTLMIGDIVIVKVQSTADRPMQMVLVKAGDEEPAIRRLDIKNGGIVLIGDNTEQYPPRYYTDKDVRELPVRVEGIAVRLIRDFRKPAE